MKTFYCRHRKVLYSTRYCRITEVQENADLQILQIRIFVQENADPQIRGLGLGLGSGGKCGSADPHTLAVRITGSEQWRWL